MDNAYIYHNTSICLVILFSSTYFEVKNTCKTECFSIVGNTAIKIKAFDKDGIYILEEDVFPIFEHPVVGMNYLKLFVNVKLTKNDKIVLSIPIEVPFVENGINTDVFNRSVLDVLNYIQGDVLNTLAFINGRRINIFDQNFFYIDFETPGIDMSETIKYLIERIG